MFWPNSLYFFKIFNFIKFNFKNPVFRFLVIASISIWVFFEIIPTKLPEYILPTYPLTAMLLAACIFSEDKYSENKYVKIFDQIYSILWLGLSLSLSGVISYIAIKTGLYKLELFSFLLALINMTLLYGYKKIKKI